MPQLVAAKRKGELPPGIEDTTSGNFSFNPDESEIPAGEWITYDFEVIVPDRYHENHEQFENGCDVIETLVSDVMEIEIHAIDDTLTADPESEYWGDCYREVRNNETKTIKGWSYSTPPERPGKYDISFILRVTEDVDYSWLDVGTYHTPTTLHITKGTH